MPSTQPARCRSLLCPPALLVLAAVLFLPCLACAPGAEDETPAGESAPPGPRVESPTLELAIASLPPGWRVAVNQGNRLILERTARDDGGTLEFLLGPPQRAGVNLVDRVWEEKARIEAMPGGEYRGQNELGGAPVGRVYTSRGRFDDDSGARIEEYRALAVHPSQNRLLILDYEYPEPPAEGGPNRLEELMLVVQEVEALGGGEEGVEPAGGEGEAAPAEAEAPEAPAE